MKVLLDTCVWGGVQRVLSSAGHDVVHAGNWSEDPGDEEILARANREQRVLVTLDKDFGELAVARRQPHNGIVRLVNLRSEQQGPVCLIVLERHADDLQRGAMVTAQSGRLRIRLP